MKYLGIAVLVLSVVVGIVLLFWGMWAGMSWLDEAGLKHQQADPLSDYSLNLIAKQKCIEVGGVPHISGWDGKVDKCMHF